MIRLFIGAALCALLFASCKKESTEATYNLVFKFKFDSTQVRLNSKGLPDTLIPNHGYQSPLFNEMSAHYIELAQSATTLLGNGAVIYKAPETTVGGAPAIDFEKSYRTPNGGAFFIIPLKNVPAGEYEWLRVSLAYQNYSVLFDVDTTISGVNIKQTDTGTIASFIGYNTYINNFKIKDQLMTVSGNRKQGFWGFESSLTVAGTTYTSVDSGQAAGTTVVNPISATSPVPAGSCVVTGKIKPGKLVITGNETKDVVVEVAVSTNKSFEWQEVIRNNRWEPLKGEKPVDMGIRGMIPTVAE